MSVTSHRTHPPLLLSELRASDDPQKLLDTAFEFQNSASTVARLRFDGAGCTCYDVTCSGKRLQSGDLLSIPGLDRLTVRIGVPVPTAAGEPQYLARFSWLPETGDPVELPITLSLPVYADLSVSPSVLTAGYRPDQTPKPIPLRVLLSGRHEEDVASPPVMGNSLEFVQPGEWRAVSIEQSAGGLWRGSWETELSLSLPAGFRDQSVSSLTVRRRQDAPEAATRVSLLIQPLVGIRSPGELQFGLLAVGQPRRRRVLLTAADQLAFRVIEVQCDDPRCRIEIDEPIAATRHWLEFEVLLPEPLGLHTQVTCLTDHPEAADVRLAVHAEPVRPEETSAGSAAAEPAAASPVPGKSTTQPALPAAQQP